MPQMILPNPSMLDNASLSSPASSLCGNPNPHWVTPAQPPLNGILRNSLSRDSPPVSTQSSENGGKVRLWKTIFIRNITYCFILFFRLFAILRSAVVLPEYLVHLPWETTLEHPLTAIPQIQGVWLWAALQTPMWTTCCMDDIGQKLQSSVVSVKDNNGEKMSKTKVLQAETASLAK